MAKKILLVNDNEEFITVVKPSIENNGYEVDIAHNCRECLEKISQNKPGVVVVDVAMPDLEGYNTCAELKTDKKTKSIPVILLTEERNYNYIGMKYAHYHGENGEADDYIPKPVEPEVLIQAINKLG